MIDTIAVKEFVNMRDVIEAAGLEPNRSGMIICPFHDDSSPSFKIYSHSWRCFGSCNEGGDQIDFIRKYYDLSFKDAVRHLGFDTDKEPSPDIIERMKLQKRKREKERHKAKTRARLIELMGVRIAVARRLLSRAKTMAEVEGLAWLYDRITLWGYFLNILIDGNVSEKAGLAEVFRASGI